MDCDGNQCCAVSTNNTRCVNTISHESNHCELHRYRANKLYLKYKRLSDRVDSLDINKTINNLTERIRYLMECYVILNKTFNARMKHRKYAFVPECYDQGHDYQFIKLKGLINKCENILSKLYSRIALERKASMNEELSCSSTEESVDVKEVNSEQKRGGRSSSIPNNTNVSTIKKYTKRRESIEADTEKWINSYIQENKVILERKSLLINNITKFILMLFNPYDMDDASESAFEKCVMVANLTRKLYSIGYLSHDGKGNRINQYIPKKCGYCNCGEYEAINLLLVCNCIFDNNSIFKYLNLSSEDSLKTFFGILLHNKKEIVPLINDIKSLYIVHRENTMLLKLYLIWNLSYSRLIIQQNLNPSPIKPSKILAMVRSNRQPLNIKH